MLSDRNSEVVNRLRGQGGLVAIAGGDNDAPALAAADVSIAMGTGIDVAIESAGATLLNGYLMGIVKSRALSRSRASAARAPARRGLVLTAHNRA